MRRVAKTKGNVSAKTMLAAQALGWLVLASVALGAPAAAELSRKPSPQGSAERNPSGEALAEQGKLLEAEAVYRSALAKCGNCAVLIPMLNNLGELNYTSGRYAAAGSFYQRALALRESDAGPDAPVLLPLLNNLALVSCQTADYGRARRFAERARSIVEIHGAADTLEGAATLAILGEIAQLQGNIAEARKWLSDALSMRESLLGQSHPLIAETLSDLALADRFEGRFEAASQLYRRALVVLQEASQGVSKDDRKTLLDISKRSGIVRSNLGQVEAQQGHLKEAEQLSRRSIVEMERAFGPQHPDTAAALVNLAKILRYRHRIDEAAQTLRRAEEIDRREFPPDHPRIAQDLSLEAALAFDGKNYAEAEKLFQQCLVILTRRVSSPQRDIGRSTADLAEVYLRQKRFTEAASTFEKALTILEQTLGPENPELLSTMAHYAQLLRAQQDFAKAASLDARVMKIRVTHALRRAA